MFSTDWYMKPVMALSLMIFLSAPVLVHADGYRIRLKNGQELLTTRYWEAGNQLMFDTASGSMGVPKDAIQEIQATQGPGKALTGKETSATGGREQQQPQTTPRIQKERPPVEPSRSETIT
jgi:hypothetical protein